VLELQGLIKEDTETFVVCKEDGRASGGVVVTRSLTDTTRRWRNPHRLEMGARLLMSRPGAFVNIEGGLFVLNGGTGERIPWSGGRNSSSLDMFGLVALCHAS